MRQSENDFECGQVCEFVSSALSHTSRSSVGLRMMGNTKGRYQRSFGVMGRQSVKICEARDCETASLLAAGLKLFKLVSALCKLLYSNCTYRETLSVNLRLRTKSCHVQRGKVTKNGELASLCLFYTGTPICFKYEVYSSTKGMLRSRC